MQEEPVMPTIYDFSLPALDGSTIDFKAMQGRPILIVNTASKCGFTPQYEGLQATWSRYRNSGLMVIGVPSNDFGKQELDTAGEISTFCSRNYGVSFPVADKSEVRGTHAIPLFQWLVAQGGFLSRPRWNFYKYLIDREGQLSRWFTSITSPEAARFQTAIDRVVLDR